ncbi:unnamed protein product [Rhizophagus irregularis]|nr:unnamed protein product [Rhizophagus irregularis]
MASQLWNLEPAFVQQEYKSLALKAKGLHQKTAKVLTSFDMKETISQRPLAPMPESTESNVIDDTSSTDTNELNTWQCYNIIVAQLKMACMSLSARLIQSILWLCILTYPQHAGTCDVTKVDSSPHAGNNGENIVKGDGGYKITTKKESDNYVTTLNGPEPFQGLLIYVEDKNGTRFGEFTLDNKMLQHKSCEGIGEHNTLTHTSKDPKNLPLDLKWKSDSNFDEAVVRAVVVINFKHWFHLDDVKFKSS